MTYDQYCVIREASEDLFSATTDHLRLLEAV